MTTPAKGATFKKGRAIDEDNEGLLTETFIVEVRVNANETDGQSEITDALRTQKDNNGYIVGYTIHAAELA